MSCMTSVLESSCGLLESAEGLSGITDTAAMSYVPMFQNKGLRHKRIMEQTQQWYHIKLFQIKSAGFSPNTASRQFTFLSICLDLQETDKAQKFEVYIVSRKRTVRCMLDKGAEPLRSPVPAIEIHYCRTQIWNKTQWWLATPPY